MNPVPQYADLLRALDGMRNLRAIVIVIAGFILAFLVAAVGIATQWPIAMFLFGVIAWLIAGFGSNAAGIVLMHQALDQPPPTIGEALFGGVTSFLKLLAIFLILALVAVLYTLVVAILLFVCKMPFVGPLLFAVLLPVLIVVSGAAYIGLIVGAGLMAPAVWHGAGIGQALTEFFTILRDKLIETIVRFFLLILLIILVFGVVMLILGAGMGYTVGLSAGIIGNEVSGGFGSLMGLGSRYSLGGSSGYIYASVFGLGILYALVLGVGFCVATMGNITIYLAVSSGVRAETGPAKMQAAIAPAAQAAVAMEQRRQAPPPPVPPVSPVCPGCRAPVLADDVFCGACGHRLR